MACIILDEIMIPRDTHFLYQAMTAEDQYLYSTRLQFQSENKFENWLICRLQHDFHDFYIVRDRTALTALGYVYDYDFSLNDGNCKLVVYMLPEYRETGLGGIAAVLFIKNIFHQYPLRKVYSTIYEYNQESLQSNLAAGFETEGILRDYRYHDGNYYSMYCLSMSRQKFTETIGKLVR